MFTQGLSAFCKVAYVREYIFGNIPNDILYQEYKPTDKKGIEGIAKLLSSYKFVFKFLV